MFKRKERRRGRASSVVGMAVCEVTETARRRLLAAFNSARRPPSVRVVQSRPRLAPWPSRAPTLDSACNSLDACKPASARLLSARGCLPSLPSVHPQLRQRAFKLQPRLPAQRAPVSAPADAESAQATGPTRRRPSTTAQKARRIQSVHSTPWTSLDGRIPALVSLSALRAYL